MLNKIEASLRMSLEERDNDSPSKYRVLLSTYDGKIYTCSLSKLAIYELAQQAWVSWIENSIKFEPL